jgi:ribosomal protein L37E
MLMMWGLANAFQRFVPKIWLHFEKLQEQGPPRGCFPEPSKSVLIAQDHNKEKAEACFEDFGFKVLTGSCCFGGFGISNKAKQRKWGKEKA